MDADDHAILGRLKETFDAVEADFAHYELNRITQHLYAFFWTDFCDWYVEVSKTKLKDPDHAGTVLAIQDYVIRELLLMLHPFTPFITEELWSRMGYGEEGSFIQDARQSLGDFALELETGAIREIAAVRETVTNARSLKAEYQLAAKRDVAFSFEASDDHAAIIDKHRDKISALLGAGGLDRVSEKPEGSPAIVTPLATFYLDLKGSIDVEAERVRLQKELDKLEKIVRGLEAKLSNEKFVSNAPEKIVLGARAQLAESKAKHEEIQRLLDSLDG
jgi:valyl-tRNA synthetase